MSPITVFIWPFANLAVGLMLSCYQYMLVNLNPIWEAQRLHRHCRGLLLTLAYFYEQNMPMLVDQ